MRKANKKGGKKKEGNLPKPLPSFSFFHPLLSLLSNTIHIKLKIINYLRLKRVLEEHRNVAQVVYNFYFFYFYVDGGGK